MMAALGGDGAWGVRGRARKRLWLYDTLSSLPTPGGGVTALVRVLGVGPVYVDVAIPPGRYASAFGPLRFKSPPSGRVFDPRPNLAHPPLSPPGPSKPKKLAKLPLPTSVRMEDQVMAYIRSDPSGLFPAYNGNRGGTLDADASADTALEAQGGSHCYIDGGGAREGMTAPWRRCSV